MDSPQVNFSVLGSVVPGIRHFHFCCEQMQLLETAQGSLGDRSAHMEWANTGAYSRMQLSLAPGETEACVKELR